MERPRGLLEGRKGSGEGEEVDGGEKKPNKMKRGRHSFIEVKRGGCKGVLGAPLRPEVAYHKQLTCIGRQANCVSTIGGRICALGALRRPPKIRKP